MFLSVFTFEGVATVVCLSSYPCMVSAGRMMALLAAQPQVLVHGQAITGDTGNEWVLVTEEEVLPLSCVRCLPLFGWEETASWHCSPMNVTGFDLPCISHTAGETEGVNV